MGMQKPNISVIVPIYNVEPYLRRCVDSLVRQTYGAFELILVNDGSTDNCGEICEEYFATDDRIQVIHKKNGGLSDARNAGLEIACGEYIAFVDSDDWVSPNFLERMLVALLESDSDICECEALKTSGEEVAASESGILKVFETSEAVEQLIHEGDFRQHVWNKLYRREVVGDIYFPVGKTNEDEFWTYQVFGRANRVCKITDVLYNYYQRSGSIMNTSYSLKRLHALEAKLARQHFIEGKFPQLAAKSMADLWLSCLYAAQMSMKHLSTADFEEAKKKINHYIREISIDRHVLRELSKGSAVWVIMSRFNFWGVCWLRNLAKRGL